MKTCKLTVLMSFVFTLTIIIFAFPARAQISHLELGAANVAEIAGNRPTKFAVLERTTEDLIQRYGAEGVIYLNDREASGLSEVSNFLRNWLLTHGYPNVRVVNLPGDFFKIEIPRVTTMHLSHPPPGILPSHVFSSKSNQAYVAKFLALAAKSETGLRITTFCTGGDYSYMSTFMNLVDGAGVARLTELGPGMEYVFGNGQSFQQAYPNERIGKSIDFLLEVHPPEPANACLAALLPTNSGMGPVPRAQ